MLVLKDPATGSSELAYVHRALEQGELVVVPTDTVYGLAALASDEAAVRRMYECKGRDVTQPTAVVFSSIGQLQSELPELGVRATWAVHSLLPGPWTLVLDNPGDRWTWLTGGEAGPIGVRVPAGAVDLPPIAATSANVAGETTAAQLSQLDPALVDQVSCAIDRGVLPPEGESTVLDLVAWSRGEGDVRVLRDTSGRAGQALAVLADAP
ncbi:MAG: threonylcarbamoyl-AMP synthase [Thermoleophilia bacterium]|nr:threonylcarbamoyl-AMP synthase [Thermoleophilia bacterium]